MFVLLLERPIRMVLIGWLIIVGEVMSLTSVSRIWLGETCAT